MHGIAVWGANLSAAHVTRLDTGAGRRQHDVVHHEGRLAEADVTEVEGVLVTMPARAVVEATGQLSVEAAVVSADSALHLGLTDPAELRRTHDAMQTWPFTRRTHAVLAFSDGRAESPGESRSRLMFRAHGVPAPILQFPVYDDRGVLIGITDFAWPDHRVLGEFDGRVKYGRLLLPGQEPGDVVFAEKQREDRLREVTDMRMFRMTWSDLYRGAETTARLRRALQRPAA